MAEMTKERLQEIKKRLEDEPSGTWDIVPWPDRIEISVLDDGPPCDIRTARFLSQARFDMEDLIEEVERLRAAAGSDPADPGFVREFFNE